MAADRGSQDAWGYRAHRGFPPLIDGHQRTVSAPTRRGTGESSSVSNHSGALARWVTRGAPQPRRRWRRGRRPLPHNRERVRRRLRDCRAGRVAAVRAYDTHTPAWPRPKASVCGALGRAIERRPERRPCPPTCERSLSAERSTLAVAGFRRALDVSPRAGARVWLQATASRHRAWRSTPPNHPTRLPVCIAGSTSCDGSRLRAGPLGVALEPWRCTVLPSPVRDTASAALTAST